MQHSPLEEAKKLALEFNCTTENTRDMVDCVRAVDPADLFTAEGVKLYFAKVQFEFMFTAAIDFPRNQEQNQLMLSHRALKRSQPDLTISPLYRHHLLSC